MIELLVVIAIIGILSALIIIGMNSATQKAAIAKAKVFSSSLRDSLMSNLKVEWGFDGLATAINGTSIPDTWSGVNNGTLATGTGDASDKLKTGDDCVSEKCLLLDTDDYINCGSNASITTNLNAWTISAWVKPADTSRNILIGFDDTAYASIRLNNTTGAPIIYMGTNNYRYFATAAWTTLKNGNWHNVVFTIPGSAQADITSSKMYLDGQEVATSTTVSSGVQATKDRFWISRVTTYYGSGSLDEIRVYDQVMPTSQIRQDYFAGLNGLYKDKQLTQTEYIKRIVELRNNLAQK